MPGNNFNMIILIILNQKGNRSATDLTIFNILLRAIAAIN